MFWGLARSFRRKPDPVWVPLGNGASVTGWAVRRRAPNLFLLHRTEIYVVAIEVAAFSHASRNCT
jgi:hypothetical protein